MTICHAVLFYCVPPQRKLLCPVIDGRRTQKTMPCSFATSAEIQM